MISSIFNICSCFLYFTELTWLHLIKLKTTLYTAVSINIDAYYWDTQGVVTFCFRVVKCPGYRDLNKCQILTHPVLNSCQMLGGCLGGVLEDLPGWLVRGWLIIFLHPTKMAIKTTGQHSHNRTRVVSFQDFNFGWINLLREQQVWITVFEQDVSLY